MQEELPENKAELKLKEILADPDVNLSELAKNLNAYSAARTNTQNKVATDWGYAIVEKMSSEYGEFNDKELSSLIFKLSSLAQKELNLKPIDHSKKLNLP